MLTIVIPVYNEEECLTSLYNRLLKVAIENGATLPLRFYLYPLLTIGLCFYLYTLRNNRILMFSIGLFLVNLLFSLNIIDMYRATIVADRYFYLSGVGLILFVCYGFMQLLCKLTINPLAELN